MGLLASHEYADAVSIHIDVACQFAPAPPCACPVCTSLALSKRDSPRRCLVASNSGSPHDTSLPGAVTASGSARRANARCQRFRQTLAVRAAHQFALDATAVRRSPDNGRATRDEHGTAGGELLKLRWSSVDFDPRLLTIEDGMAKNRQTGAFREITRP